MQIKCVDGFVLWAYRKPVCSTNKLPWSELTSASLDEVPISEMHGCTWLCDHRGLQLSSLSDGTEQIGANNVGL